MSLSPYHMLRGMGIARTITHPRLPRSTSRGLIITTRRNRDVLARFHRPPFPSSGGETFLTSSTVPAGTSFQEVPPPNIRDGDVGLQRPVPAMLSAVPPKSGGDGIDVRGVHVPPKPRPPGDEECCMSGCVHCVYTIYAEELEEYAAALEQARKALVAARVPPRDWPSAVQDTRKEGNQGMVEKAKKDMEERMDPTMAAFFALENKLKKKQAPESSAATAI